MGWLNVVRVATKPIHPDRKMNRKHKRMDLRAQAAIDQGRRPSGSKRQNLNRAKATTIRASKGWGR